MEIFVVREREPPPIKAVQVTLSREEAYSLHRALTTAHKSFDFNGQHVFLQTFLDALYAQGVTGSL